jgi:hypothetical protein
MASCATIVTAFTNNSPLFLGQTFASELGWDIRSCLSVPFRFAAAIILIVLRSVMVVLTPLVPFGLFILLHIRLDASLIYPQRSVSWIPIKPNKICNTTNNSETYNQRRNCQRWTHPNNSSVAIHYS